jgi:uncharacterized protein YqgV (UPF0045/DUF77 family)
MSVLVAFSMTPLGAGERVGEIVAEAVRVVCDSGLPHRTDAMFTTVEGETWDEVIERHPGTGTGGETGAGAGAGAASS